MVSPMDMLKRLGVGGRLVPFFKCVGVYFVAGCGATPSAAAVAAKCAPVLCLLLFVALQAASATPGPGQGYARRVAAGLALSALGDALLVWPEHFVAGMAAFALAHVAYIGAFRLRSDASPLGLAGYVAAAVYLTQLRPPGALQALVPAYAALLTTTAWRGAARALRRRSRAATAGAVGALLFLVSDAILGYGLFGGPVPNKQVLVMSTYYLGQLGIALSALDQPRPAPAPARAA